LEKIVLASGGINGIWDFLLKWMIVWFRRDDISTLLEDLKRLLFNSKMVPNCSELPTLTVSYLFTANFIHDEFSPLKQKIKWSRRIFKIARKCCEITFGFSVIKKTVTLMSDRELPFEAELIFINSFYV
jgi:hypothetical protein